MDKKEYFKLAGDEFSNKYGENNPYYKSEESFITKLSEKEKEINDKRIHAVENPRKEYSASIDGPGIMIENEDIIMDDMENITPKPSYNRMQEAVRVRIEDKENETVTVKKSFLEKLKDFEYWKEWKNQG